MSEHKFEFTFDWISGYHATWERLIPVKSGVRVLEIGCFEGRSTVWFLQRFPNCKIACIDTFEGGLDHKQLGIDFSSTQDRFWHNVKPWMDQVYVCVGESSEALIDLRWSPKNPRYDIILVDGSHTAPDVLSDCVLSWPLLSQGGTMILDDFGWGNDRPALETPRPAIDAFLAIFAGQYELLEKGYQVIIRKK